MTTREEHTIQCPYCWEPLHILVDPGDAGDEYIEDCQVCCQPIHISVREDSFSGSLSVSAAAEND